MTQLDAARKACEIIFTLLDNYFRDERLKAENLSQYDEEVIGMFLEEVRQKCFRHSGLGKSRKNANIR